MSKAQLQPPISMAWLTRLPAAEPSPLKEPDSDFSRVTPTQGGSASWPRAPSRQSQRPPLHPPSPVNQLSDCDPPEIDETDRTMLDTESLVRAAMVLDILATKTTSLTSGPAILDELSGSLIEVAHACKLTDQSAEELMTVLRGADGAHRELLSRSIQSSQNGISEQSELESRCAPDDVARALEQIATLTRVAIREATLVLDSESLVDYRKV